MKVYAKLSRAYNSSHAFMIHVADVTTGTGILIHYRLNKPEVIQAQDLEEGESTSVVNDYKQIEINDSDFLDLYLKVKDEDDNILPVAREMALASSVSRELLQLI